MSNKLLFFAFICIFCSSAAYARPLPLILDKDEKYAVKLGNETTTLIDMAFIERYWEYVVPSCIVAVEAFFNWFVKRFKNESSSLYCYIIFIVFISQSSSTILSYIAMETGTKSMALIGCLLITFVCSNGFYYVVCEYRKKHGLKKNFKYAVIFFCSALIFTLIKVYLYQKCENFYGGIFKLLGAFIFSIYKFVIPWIVTIYCDILLKYITCKKLSNIVLEISKYEQLQVSMDLKLISVGYDNGCILEEPKFEVFANMKIKTLHFRFSKNSVKWLIKCNKNCDVFLQKQKSPSTDYVIVIKNAIRLSDEQTIDLNVYVKSKKSAKEFRKIFANVFDDGLETVSSNLCVLC